MAGTVLHKAVRVNDIILTD